LQQSLFPIDDAARQDPRCTLVPPYIGFPDDVVHDRSEFLPAPDAIGDPGRES
jgi:hypothetical protein